MPLRPTHPPALRAAYAEVAGEWSCKHRLAHGVATGTVAASASLPSQLKGAERVRLCCADIVQLVRWIMECNYLWRKIICLWLD